MYSKPIENLVRSFMRLPSVGRRTAERYVFQLLKAGKTYASGAIKRKYQSDKYHKVGKLKIQLKNDEKPIH